MSHAVGVEVPGRQQRNGVMSRGEGKTVDDILVNVCARPATFATRGEAAWREAVAEMVGTREVPECARFEVELEFRLPLPTRANEAWDLDNLVKPTLDALGGVIGFRRWNGRPQADDERIDRIVAAKRPTARGEAPGANIRITRLPAGCPRR